MRIRFQASLFFFALLLLSGKVYSQSTAICDSLIQRGIGNMLNHRFVPAFDDLYKAKRMADANNWYKQQFLTTNNIGLTYFKMLDYGNAVSHFLTAYELAIKNRATLDEMTVLNNIAIVYVRDNNPGKAAYYFLKSYQIAVKEKIPSRIGLYATNLAQINLETGNLKVAEEYIEIALENLKDKPVLNLNALIVRNTLLLEQGHTREVARNCETLLGEAEKSGLLEETVEISILLSKANADSGDWNKARFYARKALQSCVDNEVKIKIFQQIAHIALSTYSYEEAISAKDSVILLTNLINHNKNKELLDNSKLKFELASSEHALEISQTRVKNQKTLYLIITLLMIPMVSALIWVYHKRSVVASQNRIIAENSLKIKELELENEKIQTALLKNELVEKDLLAQLEMEKQKEKETQLIRKIEQKNKQLADKILFQSTRNELIEEILKSISSMSGIAGNELLVKSIHELENHLKDDSRWEEIITQFESVNVEFVNALKSRHADLNANDIRFLSFVYLNLSNKEIASLLHITPEGCRKRKERITAKLGLDDNQTLLVYLSGLH